MPSLSAPGREKDQRGGEKVAAEDFQILGLYGWLSNLEAALVNERKTSADRKIKELPISLEETRAQDSWRSPKRSRET